MRIILNYKHKTHASWIAASLVGLLLSGCGLMQPAPRAPAAPAAPTVFTKKLPKLGLALGGGAARGFAHVGVIQMLEEAGIKPDVVVGTSAGSLVAALYASGKTGAQLQVISESMEEAALTDWTLPFVSRGMLRGEALARYVSGQVGGKPIESFPMPLGIVATDLHNGKGVLFVTGDTATAVRASSAVPGVFQPVKIGTREYVDGGLVSPVPVRYARQMGAEVVIAVDISASPESNPALSAMDIMLQTFAIMSLSINSFELREADVAVRPSLAGVSSADFASKRRSIEAGRAAMLAALPLLRTAMAVKSQ